MDLLKRNISPILPEAWELIDEEAKRVLKLRLSGRKLVDFCGPYGWEYAGVNTGRLELLPAGTGATQVPMGLREVQPLVEVRIPITLSIMELDTVGRGGDNPDLDPVVEAAEKIALLEDTAIFNGLASARIKGMFETIPHPALPVRDVLNDLPEAIIRAKEVLRNAGVNGPYALVLGTQLHDEVFAATEDGYPLAKHIEEQRLVDKPIVRAEAITGGAVLSLRGGDYELAVGQDLSIGYAYHTKEEVELYLTESFTFRVLEPTAAVRITSGAEGASVA